MKGIFIGATGQNVGKTTVCLGLIAAFKQHFPRLGFMKPVGQQHEEVEPQLLVDKDVVLFKEHFKLPLSYQDMSPIIFPSGFTKKILDEKVSIAKLKAKIQASFTAIEAVSDFTIVEGTGHVGVGSIASLSNADVAAMLGLDMIIIVEGGLGKAFDELALNKALLDQKGVKLKGVILNRVIEEKKPMITEYIQKALKRWDVPLIGTIPYNKFLNTPSMEDFETLFQTTLLSGEAYHYRHFESMRLVATSLQTFRELIYPNQLIVTPATREDIVLAVIEHNLPRVGRLPEHGLILTGRYPPSSDLVAGLKEAKIPALYAAYSSFDTMRCITSFTAKIRKEDISKVKKAIHLVTSNIDLLLI